MDPGVALMASYWCWPGLSSHLEVQVRRDLLFYLCGCQQHSPFFFYLQDWELIAIFCWLEESQWFHPHSRAWMPGDRDGRCLGLSSTVVLDSVCWYLVLLVFLVIPWFDKVWLPTGSSRRMREYDISWFISCWNCFLCSWYLKDSLAGYKILAHRMFSLNLL